MKGISSKSYQDLRTSATSYSLDLKLRTDKTGKGKSSENRLSWQTNEVFSFSPRNSNILLLRNRPSYHSIPHSPNLEPQHLRTFQELTVQLLPL
jgi:hypothetical protein